ncbi:glycosyltransferase family 4 protein [Halosquirtibacter laminarini]|uniref:Glycosyltransferase family 4 protein n=1 Tax=Halosquirtibacter laminarini TaxID=3374600 RepID=A0AC61NBM2_9BACT|nr:glycosyltransferase family 4 protein [Prolixibacteraceae bacterium]
MKKVVFVTTVSQSLVFFNGACKVLQDSCDITMVSNFEGCTSIKNKKSVGEKYHIKFHRRINLLGDIISLFQLIILLVRLKPDMIHSMTPKAGLLSMVAGKFARVPIRIHTFTGLIFPTQTGFKRRILVLMDRITCMCATKIIPEGNGVKNDLLNSNITSKELRVVGNGNVSGIDTEFFSNCIFSDDLKNSLKCRYKISNDDIVLVFVGRLVGDKGVNELVESFVLLSKKHLNIKLLLVGPRELEDPISSSTISTINNSPNIIEVGWQKDIRPFLAISDIFVLPSYREGFPNAVLQAGSMGLPSIVTDINGCNEIIVHNENGVIVPAKSVDALSNACDKLINDLNLRSYLASNSRRMIITRFEQTFVRSEMRKMYEEQFEINN